MSRNVFENNGPEITEEEIAILGGKRFVALPALRDGEWYELTHIGDRVFVVVEQG